MGLDFCLQRAVFACGRPLRTGGDYTLRGAGCLRRCLRDRFIKIWTLLRPLLDAHQGAPTGFRQRSEALAKFDTVAFLRCRIFFWQE